MTNSTHFVSTVSNDTILDNEILVSFDVESLFINVPIEAAVQAALQKLENDPSLADRTAQIAELLTFILRSTYFQCKGSIYEQKDGAAMGVRFPLLLLTSTWSTTSVYRKTPHTDQYLSYDSHYPQSVKRDIVKCLNKTLRHFRVEKTPVICSGF